MNEFRPQFDWSIAARYSLCEHAPADSVSRLKHDHGKSRLPKPRCCCQPRDPCSDDNYVWFTCHRMEPSILLITKLYQRWRD